MNYRQIYPYLSKKMALLLVLCLGLSNCGEDFFELERPPQNPWTTLADFESSIIGTYGILFADREWVQAWPNYAVIMTSLGDDIAFVNDEQWGYLRRTSEGTDLSNRNWWLLYRGIGAANVALDFIEENAGNPYPEASAEELQNTLDRIVGELHFMRGFSYYLLQTTFGHAYQPNGSNAELDIPLYDSFVSSAEEAINSKIGTTQEVWDFILADFQKAKELLPEQYNPALHHPSFAVRGDRFAAAGMLMRTYFQRGEYEKAKEECNYIIQEGAGRFDLSEDPIEAFNKSGFAERGREVIWYLSYGDQTLDSPSHLSVLNATWNGSKCIWNETRMSHNAIQRLGWMDSPTTDTTINLTAKRDKRFQQLFQIRYPQNQANPIQETDDRTEISNITSIWPFKYYRGPGEDFTNVPMMRLAEVYLTRSILRYLSGDRSGAAEDYNLVRSRSWDESVAGPYLPIDGSNLSEDMIHDERLIELFNEADRVNYLRSLKKDIPAGDRNEGPEPYTSERFIWLIPETETLYNEGLTG